MTLTIGTREQLSYQTTGFGFSMQTGVGLGKLPVPRTSSGDQVELSDASRTAIQHSIQELDISAEWADMKFDLGNGITANAKFSLNYAQYIESLDLSFTFSAASMGYTKEDFNAFGGKPIQMKFELFQQSIEVVKESKLTISETKRSAEDIISDIATALWNVFRQKGDKSVRLSMDTDAFQTLLENVDTRNMLDDIVALIGIINDMRLHGGPRDHYQIHISGKGKPTIDYEEKVDVKIEGSRITLQLTILPPGEKDTEITEGVPEEVPAVPAEESTA